MVIQLNVPTNNDIDLPKDTNNQLGIRPILCHAVKHIYPSKSLPELLLLVVGSEGSVYFFVHTLSKHNNDTHIIKYWEKCIEEGRGTCHVGGRVLSVDWLRGDSQEYRSRKLPAVEHNYPLNDEREDNDIQLKLLSSGTDGRLIIWNILLKLQPNTSCKNFIIERTNHSVPISYGKEICPIHAQWAAHLLKQLHYGFAASATSGDLLISWTTDRSSRVVRKIKPFHFIQQDENNNNHNIDSNEIPSLLVFAWVGNALIWGNKFSKEVGVVMSNDWTNESLPIHTRLLGRSFGRVTAIAGCISGNTAAWTDITSVVVFVKDPVSDTPILFTLQWSGLPFTSLCFPNDNTLIAVGFDGIPVVFSKVDNNSKFDWTYTKSLISPPCYLKNEKELIQSLKNGVGPWALRNVTTLDENYVVVSGDAGSVDIYVWK